MDLDNIIKNLSAEDPEFIKKCSFISENIISGSLPMVTLIEKLDFLLTNTSSDKRQLGVNIFAEVLEKIPSDFLKPEQVELISTFFINKFKDHHTVIPPTIKGLISIVQLKNFPPQHIPIMLTTMVDNIACQQQQQSDRHNIYRLFEILLVKFSEELISMGVNFTYIMISSIDGERDPRNLMFLFKLISKYLRIIPLGHLVEDMFDVLACYFPVDFKTPSNNSAITRENLAEALCPCLCAVPEFGEPCIELALEKLDSSLEIAKIDSLELLKEGCKTFKPETYLDISYKIWSQIHKEIFTTTNPKIRQQCLETLTKVINKMSQGYDVQFKNFLHDILDTLKGNLLPESKPYKDSVEVLLYISQGSSTSSAIIMSEIVPILINTFSIAPSHYKARILCALVKFTENHLKQNNNQEQKKELETVLSLCFQSISDENEDLRKEVFNSLSSLTPYLTDDMRKILYKIISSYFVTADTSAVREAFNKTLIELSKHYKNEIEEIISQVTLNDSLSLDLYLTAICSLATLDSFRRFVANTFVNYMGENTELGCVVIRNLNKLLQEQQNDTDYLSIFVEKNVVGVLIEFSIKYISETNVKNILPDVASGIKTLIGCQDSVTQKVILSHWLTQLSDGLETTEDFVILLYGLIVRLNRDVEIEWHLVNKLHIVALNSAAEENKEVSAQLLANIINKKTSDNNFVENLQILKNKFEHSKAFMALSWITKALVTRNHSDGLSWLSLLLNNLDRNSEAAEGFKIILDETYDCLSPKSKCIIMPLYQQKVFVYTVDKISANFSQTTPRQYFKTFGYILRSAPEEVILIQFAKISKLILMSLEHSNDDEILLILLQTIKKIISSNKIDIVERLEDYVTRILKLTQFQGSMKVRIEAIQFINSLLSICPLYKILQVKKTVLEELGHCVDDNKRLVRKTATETRSLWFLLDLPVD